MLNPYSSVLIFVCVALQTIYACNLREDLDVTEETCSSLTSTVGVNPVKHGEETNLVVHCILER